MQFQEKVSILERKLVDKDIANGMPTGGGNNQDFQGQKSKSKLFFQKMHFLAKDSHQRHIRIIVDESEPEDDSETPKNIHFLFFVSFCTSHFLNRTKKKSSTDYLSSKIQV